jgi:hypothetical protein
MDIVPVESFPWHPGIAIQGEPRPSKKVTIVTPPKARDGFSRSPLGKSLHDAKDKVKNNDAVLDYMSVAIDATVVAARIIAAHPEMPLVAAPRVTFQDTLRLQNQLHRLLQQAA